MEKRAYKPKSESRLITYAHLPTSSDVPVFRDGESIILPYDDISKLHYHNCYELGICEGGNGIFLAEGNLFSVSTGDAIFIPPKKQHYSRSINKESPCIFRFAYVQPDFLDSLLSTLPGVNSDRILSRASRMPIVIRTPNASRINEAIYADGESSDAIMLLSLAFLLLELNSSEAELLSTVSQVGVESELAEHITLNYSGNESAEELAALFHLSESQLRRRFVRTYGKAPIAYRNMIRGKIAAELLRRTDTSINAISKQIGYSAPTEFYRNFRRQYGISPSEYRKQKIN